MSNIDQEEAAEARNFYQKPAFDSFERLIANHLFAAANGEPLEGVLHITRACMTLDAETAARLKVNQPLAEHLYTISQRLLTAAAEEEDSRKTYTLHFKTLNWDQYLKPWVKLPAYGYSFSDEEARYFEELKESGDNREYFMQTAKQLTPAGYANLCSDFLLYSVPLIQDMTRKLSTLVSGETFMTLVTLYRGERPT